MLEIVHHVHDVLAGDDVDGQSVERLPRSFQVAPGLDKALGPQITLTGRQILRDELPQRDGAPAGRGEPVAHHVLPKACAGQDVRCALAHLGQHAGHHSTEREAPLLSADIVLDAVTSLSALEPAAEKAGQAIIEHQRVPTIASRTLP